MNSKQISELNDKPLIHYLVVLHTSRIPEKRRSLIPNFVNNGSKPVPMLHFFYSIMQINVNIVPNCK